MTRKDLLVEAKELGVVGRHKMTKDALRVAISKCGQVSRREISKMEDGEMGDLVFDDELPAAKGKLTELFFELAENDQPKSQYERSEELTDDEAMYLEEYIDIGKAYEQDARTRLWVELRGERAMAWSEVNSHNDWINKPLNDYKEKLNKRLKTVNPTDQQWDKAMSILSKKRDECYKEYETKKEGELTGEYKIDYNGYQGKTRASESLLSKKLVGTALRANGACKYFWESEYGQGLNEIQELRSMAWERVKENELDKKFYLYHKMLGEEVNPYLTYGEVQEETDDALAFSANLDRMGDQNKSDMEEQASMDEEGKRTWGYYNPEAATEIRVSNKRRLAEEAMNRTLFYSLHKIVKKMKCFDEIRPSLTVLAGTDGKLHWWVKKQRKWARNNKTVVVKETKTVQVPRQRSFVSHLNMDQRKAHMAEVAYMAQQK